MCKSMTKLPDFTVQYIRVYITLHSTETVHPSLQYTLSSTVEQVYRIQSIVR